VRRRAEGTLAVLLVLCAPAARAFHPLEATVDLFGFGQDDDGGQRFKAEGLRYVGARASADFALDGSTELETSAAASFLSNESAADIAGVDAISGASRKLLALDVSAGLSLRRGEVWTLRPAVAYHHQKGYVSEGVDLAVDRDLADGDATLTAALSVRFAFLDLETFSGADAGTELAGTNALSVSWRQNITPRVTTQVGAQYVRQDGYLGDSYNYVVQTNAGVPASITDEILPRRRHRGQMNGRLRWSLGANAAAGLDASFYLDSWDVRHFAVEPNFACPLPAIGRARGWWRVSRQEKTEHWWSEGQALGRYHTQDSDLGSFLAHSAGVAVTVPHGARARADEVEVALYGFTRNDGIAALGASAGLRRRW
jgi:hypothetical protein